ncbi:RHS repeat-associated core domain-containing protein [Lysobacter soli]|uniref:RHS repeat-associated core domain-containing protein n=1 Tax=Lysobacter soli TaxID=453783 RepID=UPI0037CC000D
MATTDINRAVLERSEYSPFGALLNRPISDGPAYVGHVTDAATGLTYMQQRYYDPAIGRFLSIDPVGANADTGDNFNRYWYGNNSPYVYTDPEGMCTGSHIENKDGTCAGSGDFLSNGFGPTMPGAQTVVHQAAIEGQLGVSGSGGMSGLYAANDGVQQPLYCAGGADCDFMYNQQQFLDGEISSDEFSERTEAQGAGGMTGAAIGGSLWGGIRYAPPALLYLRKNLRFDGPSPGLAYANGRVFGVSLRGSNVNVRLDYAPIPGSKGVPVLHLNFGKSGRGQAPHLVIWDPRWYTHNPLK